jgi:hypothetical protein
MAGKVGLPRIEFVKKLQSEGLNNMVLELYNANVIHVDRGERTLQMYCCFYLLSELFFSKNSHWAFRSVIVEERATQSDSEIGDIMLPSDMDEDLTDVWVEIKNYFGKDNFTQRMIRSLTRDYQKCDLNIENGGLGVVMFTFNDKELGQHLVSELSNQYPRVVTIVLGMVS